jgi:hypothetical protein
VPGAIVNIAKLLVGDIGLAVRRTRFALTCSWQETGAQVAHTVETARSVLMRAYGDTISAFRLALDLAL